MKERLVFDTESDGFLDTATKLHSVQIGTVEGTDATVYTDALPGYRPLAEGLKRLSEAEQLIGHNVIRHDFPLVNKLYPGTLRREQMLDTLVMVRLLDPEERDNSLEELGKRLKVYKGSFAGPWDTATPEMLEYAAQDVVVNRAVYCHAKKVESWGQSLQLEMDTAWAIAAQVHNGFRLDVPKAQALEAVLRGEVAEQTVALRDVFPPRWVRKEKETFVPKGDNRAQGYVKGCPLTKVQLQVFNPASRKQVADRLIGLGWRPKAYGAGGDPTVDEAVLAALPFPEAQRLVSFYTTLKLLGQLSDGKNGWLKLVKPDGRVYGNVNPNGACTGRMSHSSPNLAQVAKGHRMRELWLPREGWLLVGCDAEGLEARMLAHYLARYDGGAFGRRLLEGKKEDGTDVHSANRDAVKAIGYKVDRQGAKTLLYALIYGAQDPKLGRTVIDNLREQGLPVPKEKNPRAIGKRVRAALATSMVGIDKLVAAINATLDKVGYLTAIDGRHLFVRARHAALNTLLQGGGAIVMKKALCIFDAAHNADYYHFGYCANVHDEVQIEAAPGIAADLGRQFAAAITAAGAHFNLRCPLAGDFKVGASWAETH
jgi:DNA polymerase I